MRDDIEDRKQTILTAAGDVFARYGFKRCSMEDIAEAAGMSRPALYQHFRNKTEIFRAASEAMQQTAIDEAEVIANADAPEALADRLAAMLVAYKRPAWAKITQTPHGQEMMDLNAAIAEDVTQDAISRAEGVFATYIASETNGGVDAAQAARLLTAAAWGVMLKCRDAEAFDRDINALARIWAQALTADQPD